MGTDKLDTVRKLLAKAERAATAAEAEIYTAKAVELMARHGIDQALLAAAARPRRAGPRRDRHRAHRGGRSVQRGQGPAPGVDGERAALSGGAARGGRRPGRGRHRARVRLRPGAGRAAVHLAVAAGEQPVGGAAARSGRASRSPRTGGRGCTGSPCGCTSGWSRPRPEPRPGRRIRRRAPPRRGPSVGGARPRRSHSAGRSGVRRRVSAGRAGSAHAAVRFGLRGGRSGRSAGGPWPSRDAVHGQQALPAAAGPRWLGAGSAGRSGARCSGGGSAARWDCGARSGGDIRRTAASTRRACSARSGESA